MIDTPRTPKLDQLRRMFGLMLEQPYCSLAPDNMRQTFQSWNDLADEADDAGHRLTVRLLNIRDGKHSASPEQVERMNEISDAYTDVYHQAMIPVFAMLSSPYLPDDCLGGVYKDNRGIFATADKKTGKLQYHSVRHYFPNLAAIDERKLARLAQ